MKISSQEFKDKVASDLKIDDLGKENLTNHAKQLFYLQLLIESRFYLHKLEKLKDAVYQKLYHHYKFEFNHELRGAEIEIYIRANEEYKKINQPIREKEAEIDYLEEIVKMFQNRNFSIKNAIDLQKLEK